MALPPYYNRFPLKIVTITTPGAPFPPIGAGTNYPLGMPLGVLTALYWCKGLTVTSSLNYGLVLSPPSDPPRSPPDSPMLDYVGLPSSFGGVLTQSTAPRAASQAQLGIFTALDTFSSWTGGDSTGNVITAIGRYDSGGHYSTIPINPLPGPTPNPFIFTAGLNLGVSIFDVTHVVYLNLADGLYYPKTGISATGTLSITNTAGPGSGNNAGRDFGGMPISSENPFGSISNGTADFSVDGWMGTIPLFTTSVVSPSTNGALSGTISIATVDW